MSIEAPRFSLPEDESGEDQTENIDTYVNEGVDRALSMIKERYEDSAEERDNLPFHNSQHTEGVIRRTEAVLSAIREADPSLVSERDIALGRLAGAYHDTVQKWEENRVADGQFTKVIRRRFAGNNEKSSADESVAFMDKAWNDGDEIFSKADKAVMREAIGVTEPGWDSVNKTVVQPQLSEDSSLIARAVALADLGTAGIDGSQAFTNEGKTLFKEDNLDILDAIRNGKFSDEQKVYFKQRMLEWLNTQVGFARGRKARLAIEVHAIPEHARYAVARLFGKFDDSIRAAEEVAQRAEAMSFGDLADYMGY